MVLGDSLVKDIKGWELSDESSKVVTKHFSGANTTDMKSYLLPTKSRNPENIVLHCGTNDLKKENSANEISNDIIEVALLCKSDNNNVLVSGIIPRSDKRNAKAIEVNRHLKTNVVREIFALLVIQILTQSTTVTKVVFTLIGKERINLLKIFYLL